MTHDARRTTHNERWPITLLAHYEHFIGDLKKDIIGNILGENEDFFM